MTAHLSLYGFGVLEYLNAGSRHRHPRRRQHDTLVDRRPAKDGSAMIPR